MDLNVVYLGSIKVLEDKNIEYKMIAEEFISVKTGDTGNWTGV